jgi:hypothetical protein
MGCSGRDDGEGEAGHNVHDLSSMRAGVARAMRRRPRSRVRLRGPPKASLESSQLTTDVSGPGCYRGVGTVVTAPPGPISVLVPLPLLVRSPWPAPPGSVVVCMLPKFPVVTAGPRGVSMA